jgi:hypothetical protein
MKDRRATSCAASHFQMAKPILLKTIFIDLKLNIEKTTTKKYDL